jgi:hypothetical protein
MARVSDHPCRQSWNYWTKWHTFRVHAPDDSMWYIYPPGLLPPEMNVDAGHLLGAFDTLCIGFGQCTPPPAHSGTGKRYPLCTRRESMNSKCSVLDSKRWRSLRFGILSLADWIRLALTLSTCARTWYLFECVLSNLGRCFKIPL